MLINFTGDSTQEYAQRFAMQSHPFSLNAPSCLKLIFSSMSYFAVRLTCVDSSAWYSDKLLYRSSLKLGYKQSQLKLDIEPTNPDYDQCLLVFEAMTSNSSVTAVINDVLLLPSNCRPQLCKYIERYCYTAKVKPQKSLHERYCIEILEL